MNNAGCGLIATYEKTLNPDTMDKVTQEFDDKIWPSVWDWQAKASERGYQLPIQTRGSQLASMQFCWRVAKRYLPFGSLPLIGKRPLWCFDVVAALNSEPSQGAFTALLTHLHISLLTTKDIEAIYIESVTNPHLEVFLIERGFHNVGYPPKDALPSYYKLIKDL